MSPGPVCWHPCSTHQLWKLCAQTTAQRSPQGVPCQSQALVPCKVCMLQQRQHLLDGVILPEQGRCVSHIHLETTTGWQPTASDCTTHPPLLLCPERLLCTETAPNWFPRCTCRRSEALKLALGPGFMHAGNVTAPSLVLTGRQTFLQAF